MIKAKEVASHGGLYGLYLHDTREVISKYKNIRDSLVSKNSYHIDKKLEDVLKDAAITVKRKSGRAMQNKTMPVRECFMELPDDWDASNKAEVIRLCSDIGTIPIKRYVNRKKMVAGKKRLVSEPVLDEKGKQVISPLGIELFAVMFHEDEGHWLMPDGKATAGLEKDADGRWVDLNGEPHDPEAEGLIWKMHHHCHPWYNFIDPKTGKTIRIAGEELSQIQTIVAERLGMERGIKGSDRVHLPTEVYSRLQQVEASIAKGEEERNRISEELSDIADSLIMQNSILAGLEGEAHRKQKEVDELEERKNALNEELAREKERLDRRKSVLRTLRSYGMLKFIESIPELIKHDLGEIIGKYYRGSIMSFNVSSDIVAFTMSHNGGTYRLKVSITDGSVLVNGKKGLYKSGEQVYIKDIPEYFKTTLTAEARDMVKRLYKEQSKSIKEPTGTSGVKIKR